MFICRRYQSSVAKPITLLTVRNYVYLNCVKHSTHKNLSQITAADVVGSILYHAQMCNNKPLLRNLIKFYLNLMHTTELYLRSTRNADPASETNRPNPSSNFGDETCGRADGQSDRTARSSHYQLIVFTVCKQWIKLITSYTYANVSVSL
jgi:hypothetical protein